MRATESAIWSATHWAWVICRSSTYTRPFLNTNWFWQMPRSLFCGAGGHCSQSLIGNKGNWWSWANSSSWKVSYPTPVYAPYSDVQNVIMPSARHNPIRVRSAKLWPTVASTMKTGTFWASSCSFTAFIYAIILSHQPHRALEILTLSPLFKADPIPKTDTFESHQQLFETSISLLLKRPLNNKCPCCDAA